MGLGFDAYEPTPVPGLPADVSGIASGHYHSLAVTSLGHLWEWGRNSEAQLGHGSLSSRYELQVSLGWGHALALTKDRKLFGWGYYADGRLGTTGKALEASPLDSIADKIKSTAKDSNSIEAAEKLVLQAIEKADDMTIIWEPTLIEALQDVDVADVACGLDHSLILSRDGSLLSGGSNVYGQLGREKSD